MQIEYDVKVFPIDEALQEKVTELAAQGWELIPGIKPVAVYHVARNKDRPPAPAGVGMGRLTIDDSKVQVIKAADKDKIQ